MKINYSKLVPYNYFLENYAPIIDSELYDSILKKAEELNRRMNKISYMDPKTRIIYLNGELREEKNIYYKHLVIINSIFSEDIIYNQLNSNNTDIDSFVFEISKMMIISKLPNVDLDDISKEVSNILKKIGTYNGINNYAFIVLKLYEIKYKNTLKLEKHK